MRHTIIFASITAVAASVITTAVISGSLFGAGTASSANTPVEAGGAVSPGGVSSILQGDVDCGGSVTPVDSLKTLRHDAGLSVQQTEPCPDIATVIQAGLSLFAHVDQSGFLEVGSAVSASRVSKGNYVVTFGQNVVACAAVVTPGSRDGGVTHLSAKGVTSVPGPTVQDVSIDFYDASFNLADTDFNLIVVC